MLLLVVYEAFELVLILGKVDAHRLREGGRKVVSWNNLGLACETRREAIDLMSNCSTLYLCLLYFC